MKMTNSFLSPQMQNYCYYILQTIKARQLGYSKAGYGDSFKRLPKPVLIYAYRILIASGLISLDPQYNSYRINSPDPNLWKSTLRGFQITPTMLHAKHRIYEKTDYSVKTDKTYTPRELKFYDYYDFNELWDYEFQTLMASVTDNEFLKYEYANRQFLPLNSDPTGKKRNHIYVSCDSDKSVGAVVCISNYNEFNELSHHLPCENANIYNVNFIATRKGLQHNGLASDLLKYAINDIMAHEDVYCFCYYPICNESKALMEKTFSKDEYKIIDRTTQDDNKYGMLYQYIIMPQNNKTEEQTNG